MDDWRVLEGAQKTKAQIFVHLKAAAPKPKYVVQEVMGISKREGTSIIIIFLLVARPPLNYVEVVWDAGKQALAMTSMKFRLLEGKEATRRGIEKYILCLLKTCGPY